MTAYERLDATITYIADNGYFCLAVDEHGQSYFCLASAFERTGKQLVDCEVNTRVSLIPIEGTRGRMRGIEVRVLG